jgi:inorganic triphosphatase YgiF
MLKRRSSDERTKEIIRNLEQRANENEACRQWCEVQYVLLKQQAASQPHTMALVDKVRYRQLCSLLGYECPRHVEDAYQQERAGAEQMLSAAGVKSVKVLSPKDRLEKGLGQS